MIAGLIGTVHRTAPDSIMVNVHGVIYRVNTSSRTGETSACPWTSCSARSSTGRDCLPDSRDPRPGGRHDRACG